MIAVADKQASPKVLAVGSFLIAPMMPPSDESPLVMNVCLTLGWTAALLMSAATICGVFALLLRD